MIDAFFACHASSQSSRPLLQTRLVRPKLIVGMFQIKAALNLLALSLRFIHQYESSVTAVVL